MKKGIIILVSIICNVGCKSDEQKEKNIMDLWDKANIMSYYNKDSSLIILDQAIAIDSLNPSPHNLKMSIYCSLGKFDEAIAESETLLRLDPNFAEEWFFSGLLYEVTGDKKTAVERYQKSVEMYTEVIETTDDKRKLESAYYNRAFSKKFLDDETYIEDIKKLTKGKKHLYDGYYEDFISKTKQELMFSLMGYYPPSDTLQ